MRIPRFFLSDRGLILETPIPLSPPQREAVRAFAEKEYRRRIKTTRGDLREQQVKIIEALVRGDFLERAIPAHDMDRESILIGA